MFKTPREMVTALDYVVFSKGWGKNLYGVIITPYENPQVIYFYRGKVMMARVNDINITKIYRTWMYAAKRNSYQVQKLIFNLIGSKLNRQFLKTLNTKAKLDRTFVSFVLLSTVDGSHSEIDSKLHPQSLFSSNAGFTEVTSEL